MRYRLRIAYDGTNFRGWQKQREGDRTVQSVVEAAARIVMREPVILVGASRTDSGVHARGQVAAFTSERELPPASIVPALNSRLPNDVQVVAAAKTTDHFNPIWATEKGYRYTLAHGCRHGRLRPLFDRNIVAFTAHDLDVGAMQIAATHLVGEHDFASLTRANHGRQSTVRTVTGCTVTASSAHRLRIDVKGGGFLYNMVRIIAGTLVEVGRGHFAPDDIPRVLAKRDRSAAGRTMPPEGLCLMWIRY